MLRKAPRSLDRWRFFLIAYYNCRVQPPIFRSSTLQRCGRMLKSPVRVGDSIKSIKMKTINFSEMSVSEMEMNDLVRTDGGVTAPLSSIAARAIVAYIRFCMETGGDYVTHHVQ